MEKKKELWLIPYAHLDTQWRWEFPTTIKKYIKDTLEENIELFEKFPEYVFNFTGSLRYAMMKEYYPEKFEKIKKYVHEGRWCLSGTCLDETDTLTPCVESMIRNILYGDQWAEEEFGKSSRDYMIPDCFGFPANMPSVLRHCGIQGFSTQKLTWGSAVGIPFELGLWEGPDDSELVCALNPGSYNSQLILPLHMNKKRINKLYKLGEKKGIWKSFQYYGVGDIGGAPKKWSVKRAISAVKNPEKIDSDVEVIHGSSDQFFKEITKDEKERMDTYAGDLLLINHSAGTLTSAAIMKRWNRKNERLGFAAEVASVTAFLTAGQKYPSEKIKSAWYRTIGNQMHDILPGTSTPIAYEYSQNDEVVALNTWRAILEDAAKSIAPFIKGDGDILLFNPLGMTRRDVVDIKIPNWDETNSSNMIIKTDDGSFLPVQVSQDEQGNHRATFIPELRPFSWSRYSLKSIQEGDKMSLDNPVAIITDQNKYLLENANYKITITKDGKIPSIFHKKMEREILERPLAYEFQEESPSMFPAWNMDWKDRKKEPYLRIEDGGSVKIVEEGGLRCTIKISIPHKDSRFVRFVSLSHDSEIVEITEKIHWRGMGCSLKMAFDTNIHTDEVTYNWETSRKRRGVNREKQFEVPSRYWADISNGEWGISIIEDSKYGYDYPEEGKLRMTLLYTPNVRKLLGYWDQQWQDWGEHTIRYGIYCHEDDFKGTDQIAKRFNQEVRTFSIDKQLSHIGEEDGSLLEVADEQVGILAVKKAEKNDGIVIRLYERYGKPAQTEIILQNNIGNNIGKVQEINGLEEPLGEISFKEKQFSVQLEPNEIKSYLLQLENPRDPVNIKQEAMRLDYNDSLFGKNGEGGGLFPKELVPSSIQAGNISFSLGKNKKQEALQCKNQTLSIPEGYNTLSILLSSEEDAKFSIKWEDDSQTIIKEEVHEIPSSTGYLGQWDTRLWKRTPTRHLKLKRDYFWLNKCVGVKPGFVKRPRLEWYSTHTHKDGEDQPYQYGYFFTTHLDIPQEAKKLILPENSSIYVIAMTTSEQPVKLKSIQYLLDKYDF